MDNQFTPGPWTAGGNKPYKGNEAWIFDGSTPEKLICFLGGNLDKSRPSMDESFANAHLIAAAPDLLECLITITSSEVWKNQFGGGRVDEACINAINKALNK